MKNIFKCISCLVFLMSCKASEPVMNTWVENDVSIGAPNSLDQKKVWVGWKGGEATKSNQAKQLILNAHIWEKGITVVSNKDDADYALLATGSVKMKRDQYFYNSPTFGQTGILGGTVYGTLNGSTFSGTTSLTPTYGVTGSSVKVGTTEYWSVTAEVIIVEFDTATIIAQYAGAATIPTSDCRSDWLEQELVRHMLVDLPKLSSRSGNYSHAISSSGKCAKL